MISVLKKNLYYTIVILLTVFFTTPVFATASPEDINSALDQFAGQTGVPDQTLTEAAGSSIEFIYQITGLIFFILAVYGGVRWLTSQGNEAAVKQGRDSIVAATIGLVIVVGAYGITSYITREAVSNLSSGGGPGPIDGGAGSGNNFEPDPQGCCIYRADTRVVNYIYEIGSEADCEVTRNEARNSSGKWYRDLNSAEICSQITRCWNFTIDNRKNKCLNDLDLGF